MNGENEESQQNLANDSAINKRKRAHASRACINCRKIHAGCGKERPCNRCVAAGWQSTCRDVPRKKRRPKGQKPPEGEGKTEDGDENGASDETSPEMLEHSPNSLSSTIKTKRKTKKTKPESNLNNESLSEVRNVQDVSGIPIGKEVPLLDQTNFRIVSAANFGGMEESPQLNFGGTPVDGWNAVPRTDEIFNGMLSPHIPLNSFSMRGLMDGSNPSPNGNTMNGNLSGNLNGMTFNGGNSFQGIISQFPSPTSSSPLDSSDSFVSKKDFNTILKEVQLLRDRNLLLEHKILGITNELSTSRSRQEQLFSMINTLMRGHDGLPSPMMGYFRSEDGE